MTSLGQPTSPHAGTHSVSVAHSVLGTAATSPASHPRSCGSAFHALLAHDIRPHCNPAPKLRIHPVPFNRLHLHEPTSPG